MADRRLGYRVFLAIIVVLGVGAAGAGSIGLYTVLTDSTSETASTETLGEFGCERFDGDPEVAHEASYGLDRTLSSDDEIKTFDTTHTETGIRIEITVAGGLLDASARTVDGSVVTVDSIDGEPRLVVEYDETTPFRLWVDSVSEDATVVRTRLDVCPPA